MVCGRRHRCCSNTVALCCVQHATGMPSSYQLGMMQQQAAAAAAAAAPPYPPATSPALLQQYQYHHCPPAGPLRAPPAAGASHDYYIPVVPDHQHQPQQHQQHSGYPINIANTQSPPLHQQQLPPQPPQCYTGAYDGRPRPPATLPGVLSNLLFVDYDENDKVSLNFVDETETKTKIR